MLQTAPPKVDASLSLEFETWKPESEGYANIDAELRVRLTTLHFFGNRPTIGALMGIGKDLSLAFKSPDAAQKGDSKGTQDSERSDEDSTEDETEPSSEDASGWIFTPNLAMTFAVHAISVQKLCCC